ncbi:hypothetical protein LPJ57_008356, partial [Coemansia sp. RSA 486]
SDQIYPNFALNKLIAQGAAGTTKVQLGHHALQQQQQQSIQSLLQQQSQRQLNIVDQIRSA